MSDHSRIEWTESTWNPVVGCTHVSAGCDHCYATRLVSGRLAHQPLYAGLAHDGKFTGELRLVPERLDQPLRWRKPRMVFVNSMSDLFHDGVSGEYIARVFAVMALARRHTFQILTKRPGRMRSMLKQPDFRSLVSAWAGQASHDGDHDHDAVLSGPWPLPNVWLGVSVEDQHWADIRIPVLLDTPAAVRWVSAEPLLGPVTLPFVNEVNSCTCYGGSVYGHESGCGTEPGPAWGNLHWVVVGGESGPGARPMNVNWVQSLADQCRAAGVPMFVKQDSGPRAGQQGRLPNQLWALKDYPENLAGGGW